MTPVHANLLLVALSPVYPYTGGQEDAPCVHLGSVDWIEEWLLLCEVGKNDVCVGFGDRKRRNRFVIQFQNIGIAFFSEHLYLLDVHNVFAVASYEAAFETFLDSLEAASEHILLQFSLAVGVPYLDVVVV